MTIIDQIQDTVGQLVEIEHDSFDGVRTHVGVNGYLSKRGDKTVFLLNRAVQSTVDPDKILSLRLLDPAEYAKRFEVGTRVAVKKYGGTYHGNVVKVGRTRVTVTITLASGDSKDVNVPIQDVTITVKGVLA